MKFFNYDIKYGLGMTEEEIMKHKEEKQRNIRELLHRVNNAEVKYNNINLINLIKQTLINQNQDNTLQNVMKDKLKKKKYEEELL